MPLPASRRCFAPLAAASFLTLGALPLGAQVKPAASALDEAINAERYISPPEAAGVSLYTYPYEDHGPIARETVFDQWARWVAWLDKYVKGAGDAKPLATENE